MFNFIIKIIRIVVSAVFEPILWFLFLSIIFFGGWWLVREYGWWMLLSAYIIYQSCICYLTIKEG